MLQWDLKVSNSAGICRVAVFIVGISRCIRGGGGGVRESGRGCCGKGGLGGAVGVG